MKKTVIVLLALCCVTLLISPAFAGDTEDCRPWFKPTLRVGVAFDAAPPDITFNTLSPLLGANRLRLELPSTARLYIATELPFAVTDRLTVSLGGDWAFSAAGRRLDESYNNGISYRQWYAEGALNWVSADLLVSYALVKDAGLIKDLSVVAGVRWDYQTMSFTSPHDPVSVLTSPADGIGFRMQTLTPLAGLSCTVAVPKSGPWFGDINLSVLAGPVVWGHEHYTESFAANSIEFENDLSRGYIVKAYADVTILSGKIGPRMDAALSFFGQYTKTNVKGDVHGEAFAAGVLNGVSPGEFESDSDVVVFGLMGSLAFDICEPAPAAPAPAPAPVIEPKLEPMSKN
jgi:hypothetical protein